MEEKAFEYGCIGLVLLAPLILILLYYGLLWFAFSWLLVFAVVSLLVVLVFRTIPYLYVDIRQLLAGRIASHLVKRFGGYVLLILAITSTWIVLRNRKPHLAQPIVIQEEPNLYKVKLFFSSEFVDTGIRVGQRRLVLIQSDTLAAPKWEAKFDDNALDRTLWKDEVLAIAHHGQPGTLKLRFPRTLTLKGPFIYLWVRVCN